MPHAAVMMKVTERTELLFVWFRSFDMCQCPGIKAQFYLTGVNHSKAHRTRSKDSSSLEVWTMKNVAVVTNLGIYHWTIKQSCSAWNGTRWTHVPWCVQSHVKTQLTFWQKSAFLFSLAVLCSRASLSCVWSLPRLGSGTLRSSDYHIYIHFTECSSVFYLFIFYFLSGVRANAATGTARTRSDLKAQSKVRGGAVATQPTSMYLGWPSHCSWAELNLPSGVDWVCAHNPTSSYAQHSPIHLPSLSTEVTAGIQLFVKGL